MAYGILKCDQIIFTNGGIDQTVTVSGIVQSISGNITATGTIQGATIIGTSTVSGTTVTGNAGQFTTATITSGVFASGSAAAPSVSVGTTNNGIYSPGADQVAISTNGTQRINIEADGDINIDSGGVFYDATNNRLAVGTTSPGYNLHVSNTASIGRAKVSGSSVSTGESTIILANSLYSNSSHFDLTGGSLTLAAGAVNTNRVGNNEGRTYTGGDVSIFAGNAQYAGTTGNTVNGGNIIFGRRSVSLAGAFTDTELARLDSSGRLLVGTSSARSTFNTNQALQVQLEGTDYPTSSAGIVRNSSNSGSPSFTLAKSRGTAAGSHTIVVADDDLGTISFEGADGSKLISAARITAEVDGTPGADDMPGRLVFSTTADGASSPTERMRIDSSGRLLVGTSSARSIFDLGTSTLVTPQIQLEGSTVDASSLSLKRNDNNAGSPRIFLAKTRGGVATIVNDDDGVGQIVFNGADGTNLVEAASISAEIDGTPGTNDMPGRLVFSTTADGASSPTERMRIANDGVIDTYSDQRCLRVRSNYAAGTGTSIINGFHSATSTSNGSICFIVLSNGNVQNTNNSYGPISSDERLKQDIVDVGSQWDDIKSVRLTKFRYKNDPTGELQLGPIAQELEQVSPGLITRRPASEDEIADPSNSLVDGDEVLSFKASILYMKAVKALQEAMERIETLEAKVAALESA